jgi:hypothetical protein
LVVTPKGKRPFARHRRRWDNNIKVDFEEMGWVCPGYKSSGQGQLVDLCKHGDELLGSIKCREFLD